MSTVPLIDKALLLKKVSLFEQLELDVLLTIADKLDDITVSKNQKIFYLDEVAIQMYIIVDGQVEIKDRSGKSCAVLSDLDFFGEESLFNEKNREYEAISSKTSHLLTLSKTNLLTLIEQCPSVATHLLSSYSSSLSFRPRS